MPRTNRGKPNDMIEEFEQVYGEAFAKTRKAAETTATPAWQELYVAFMEQNQKYRGYQADCLEKLAVILREKPLDEESIKELKGSVKLSVEACDAYQAFQLYTVHPIKDTVDDLKRIIDDYERQATMAAHNTPLTDSGLPDRLADIVVKQPRAVWNERIGCVLITE